MPNSTPRFAGIELYFDDLSGAKRFYSEVLGLALSDEQQDRYAKFDSAAGFVCLERKGSESYPSQDKAVLFFEVEDLKAAIAKIGRKKFIQVEKSWAVLHDPEGHNVLLLETRR